MLKNHLRLTILCDNYVQKQHILAEHGLSFFIETEGMNILFDSGQGLAIKHNAEQLHIDLKKLDAIILSHGHYDHSGGLKEVLKQNSNVKIYAHPDALKPKYKRLKTGKMQSIGYDQVLLKKGETHFVFDRKPCWITEQILLTGEIPRETSFEKIEEEFYVQSGKEWLKDELLDDQALSIDTPSGLVVVLGCCHAGIINTLRYIIDITGKKEFALVIGGIHLQGASQEKMNKTTAALRDFQIRQLILCHCTGIPAFSTIQRTLGSRVVLGASGQIVQVPS